MTKCETCENYLSEAERTMYHFCHYAQELNIKKCRFYRKINIDNAINNMQLSRNNENKI